MAALRLVRKWGVPLATAASMPILAPVVFADSGKKENAEPDSRMVRPSDLPIYEEPEEVLDFEYHGKERTSLEEGVGVVRKEIEGMLEVTRSARERVVTIYETGKAHSMATMDYITDEENILPRAGAITIGGLAGLIIGARKKGGLVKRVLYTSTGVVTTASLCYPRQAYQISQQAYENTKDYATIGYNFVAGVKPQSKVSTPVEPKKEASTAAEDATPLPKVEVPLAPETPSPTTEPEGAEVRSVIPQILHPEKSPAPIDSLAQQASDVTQWGFKLTDRTSTTSSSPADVVAPVEPTVPDGFGSVGEINRDSAGASAEQKVIEAEAEIVNLIKEVSLPEVAEPAQAKGIPEITVEVVKDSAQKVVDEEEKVEVSLKTVDVEEVLHIAEEKVADIVEEKVAEVITEAAQEVEEDAMKVAKAAEVVEEVGSMGESALGVVENIAEAAAEALHGTSDVPESVMEKVDQIKEVTEKAEKVVETITDVAEKVEKVAEEIKTEAERIETQITEGMQGEKKSEEAFEKVPEFFTSSEILSSDEVKEVSAEVPDTEVKDAVTLKLEVSGTESTCDEPKEQIRPSDSVENELVKPYTEMKVVDVVEGDVQAAEEKVVDIVEEKVSEVVIKVAEEVKEDTTKVAEATEEIEKVDSKVDSALVVENLSEAAAEAAHYVPGVPEPVLEKIEQVKQATEEAEGVVDNVTIVAEKVEEVTEEIKREAEVIETEAAEVIQSKEKKEEALDESKVQLKPSGTDEETLVKPETEIDTSRLSDTELKVSTGEPFVEQKESDVKTSVPVEEQGLFDKLINFFSKDKKTGSVVKLVEESTGGKAKEPSAVSEMTLESGDSSAEKPLEGVEVTEAKVEDAESQEIPQPDVAKFAKDEKIPETVGEVLEPVLEEVSKDVVEGIVDKVVEKAAEVVKEAAGDIVEVVSDVVEVTDMVEEVGDKVVSLLDAIQEKTEEAQETPGVTEAVVYKADVVKQMSEGAEIVVEAVTYVADKVGDVADAIKTEATALETQAAEITQSEEKRKELIDTVTEFVGGIESSSSDVEKDTSLELPAGELKESGIETIPQVLKEEKPEEKLAEVPAVEQVVPADDSVRTPVGKEGLFDKLAHLFFKDKEKDMPAAVDKTEGVVTGTSIDAKEEGPTDTGGEVLVEGAVLTGEELKESSVEPTTQETDRIEGLVLPAEELKEPIVEITPTVLPEPVPEVSTQEEIIKENVVSVVESVVSTEDGQPKPVVREGLFDKLAHLFSKDEEKKDVQAVGMDSVVESVSEPTVEVKEPSVDPDAQEAKEPVLDKTEELVTGTSDAEEKEGLTDIKEVPVQGAVSTEKLKERSGEPTKQEAKESLLKRIKELVLPEEELKESSVETASVVLPEPEETALPAEEPSVETASVVLPEPVPEASAQEKEPEEKSADIAAVESIAPTEDSVPKPVVKEGLFDKLSSLFSKDKKDLPAESTPVDSVVEPVTEPTEKLKEPSTEPITQEEKEFFLVKTEELVPGTSTDVDEKGDLIGKKEEDSVEVVVTPLEELKEPSGEPTIQEAKELVLDRTEETALPAEELKEPSVETASVVLPEPVSEASAQEKEPEEKSADTAAVESIAPTKSVPKPVVKEGLFDKLASLFSKDEKDLPAESTSVDSVTEKLKEPSAEPTTQEEKEIFLVKTEELVPGTSTDVEEKGDLIGKKEEDSVEVVVSPLEELKEPSGEPTIQEAKELVLDRTEETALPAEELKESSVETTSVVLPEPEETALPAEELKEPSVETASVVLPEPVSEASAQEKEPEEKSADTAAVESIAPTEDSVPKPVVKEGLFDKLASLFSKDKKDLPAESTSVDSVTEKLKEPSAEPTTQEEKEIFLVKTEELVPGTSTDVEEKGDLIGKKEEDSVEVVVSPLEELKEPSGEPTIQEAKELVLDRTEETSLPAEELKESSVETTSVVLPEPEETALPAEELKEPSVEAASVVLPEPLPEASAQEKEPEEKSADTAAVESIAPTEDSGAKPVVKEGLFGRLASLFSNDENEKDLPAVDVESVVEVAEPTEKLKEASAEPTTQEAKETIFDKTEVLVKGTSTNVEEKEGHIDKKDVSNEVVSAFEELKQEVKELDKIEKLALPAEELKESSVETTGVLPEPAPEVSAQEKEPVENSAVTAVVESVAPADDSVPKSVVKEGIFDKLVSLFSKDEEKKDLPAVDRDPVIEPLSESEKLEEPSTELVTPEAKESVSDKTDELVSSTSIAAEEEGHIDTEVKEQITKELISSDSEKPAAVELKESEKSSDQIPVELHKPVVDATITPVKTEGFFSKLSGFFKDEEKKDAPVVESVVEPTAEELKEPNAQEAMDHTPEKREETVEATIVVTEEKESVIDKLASLFSKDEEKKVPVEEDMPLADSVVDSKEPASDLPDTEVKEQITEELKPSGTETNVSSGEKEGLLEELAVLISKEKEDGSLAESEKHPVVEETKEIKELSATAGEATEPVITTPDEIVKDGIIESNLVMEPATPADQAEATVVSEKKSFFGKIAGVFSGSQSEHVSDSGTVVSNSSAVIDTEPAEAIDVLPDAAASVEELPKSDTKAEELVQETDTQEKEPKEEIEPVVVAPLPPVEKGLFDKLASFLSKDEDKKDIPATDNVPATDMKETDEKSADKVSVESQEPAADATSTSGDNEGLFSKLTGFFSKDEEKKEVPATDVAPASELSELEEKSTNSGIAEVIEPAVDTLSISAEKEGLFEKVANLFSKHEQKVEEQVDGRASGADSAVKELTETSSDLSEQEITEQAVEQKTTEVNTPTITKEKEGLFDKLAGLFSKEDTNNRATEHLEESVVENAKESPTEKGETSEQLSTMPEVSSVSSGDSSAVEVDHSESSVVQDKKSFIDKITTIFGNKKEPVPAPAGDAHENGNVVKSSVEVVPDVSSEAGQGDLGETPGSVPLLGETANVPSESTPAIINTEESSLQVKDKGLFDRLAELVSGNEKKAVNAADEVSAESEPETLPGTSEAVDQEISEKSKTDSLETLTEPKSSIFDRVTNFFSNKENSKEVEKDMVSPQLVEEVPAEVTEQSENSTVTGDSDDTFVVNENPSSPADVRTPEESGEQSGDAAGSAWRGWFRTGASVKQEGKDVIVQLTPPKPAETDYGQSNPEDSDMYTTRS